MDQQLINSPRVNSKYGAVVRRGRRSARLSRILLLDGPPAEREREREGGGRKRERESTQLLAAPTRKINYVISESRDSPAGLPGTFYWSPSGWAPDEVGNIPQ